MPIFFEIAAAPNSINAFSLFRYDDVGVLLIVREIII